MSGNNVASRGDFRGDFSRDTFDPMKHFSRVLMQQGRVQLDADWNEQVSILLHYMRQLGADLMGPHGAPCGDDGEPGSGFQISADGTDFKIDFGRYYVNGILCENNKDELPLKKEKLTYFTQIPKPEGQFVVEKENKLKDEIYLVYLDVWERHLTYVEDDSMREKALGGADTATRAKVVWQVKVIPNSSSLDKKSTYKQFITALTIAKAKQPGTGTLKAQARNSGDNKKPCLSSPESTYRGAENQLYRVEIHNGNANGGTATFKWSRENGSVIFPITAINGNTISLRNFGHDDRFSLRKDDWVEVLDDDVILRNEANPLLQVAAVDLEESCVTLLLNADTERTTALLAVIAANIKNKNNRHPYLRRWEGSGGVNEENLEDGIEIQFQRSGSYQRGDYWLIPSRTATGDVEWPEDAAGEPKALLPHGVVHHYAPLAIITVVGNSVEGNPTDLRRHLNKGWTA